MAVNTLQNIGPASINAAVEEAGGDPSKVRYVELAFPDMLSALESGRVDAAWLVEPFTTQALEAGNRAVLWNLARMASNQIVSGYFTSQQYAQQNPEVVKKFRAAMQESLKYTENHPDEARDIITSYTEIEPKPLEDVVFPQWPAEINPPGGRAVGKAGSQVRHHLQGCRSERATAMTTLPTLAGL